MRRRRFLIFPPDVGRRHILKLLVHQPLRLPQLPNVHFLLGYLLAQGVDYVILERKSHFQIRNPVFESVFTHEIWSALSLIWYHGAFYRLRQIF